MTGRANGIGGGGTRTGAYCLGVLAAPMNVAVLRALSATPTPLAELRRAVGTPPQTTLRKHLTELVEAGILSRDREAGFAGTVRYALAKPGADLVAVGTVVEAWLAEAPDGPVELGSVAARSALKALAEGWSTTLMRALAARPLTLTELDALITEVSYPSLERRLVAMRMAGLVETLEGRGRGTPYAVADWLRRAVRPVVCAVCWERRHAPEATAPVGRLDIETAFLLALPLLRLDPGISGTCRLAVATMRGAQRRSVGVLVGIEEGRVAFCRARLEGDATAWASGPVWAWYRAVGAGLVNGLDSGGDRHLLDAIIAGLNAGLLRPVPA